MISLLNYELGKKIPMFILMCGGGHDAACQVLRQETADKRKGHQNNKGRKWKRKHSS